MSEHLPKSLQDGITTHIRHIEQVASETSASQSSLLKLLSSLETALRDVKSSLPNEDFVAHVEKLRALQHRIQAVSDRLAIVEERTSRIQGHMLQSAQ